MINHASNRVLGGMAAAFTLVEVMTSLLVLSLLVIVLSALFSQIVVTSNLAARRLDSEKEVKHLFDRLTFDLNAGINQTSLGFQFYKNQQAVFSASNPTPSAPANDSVILLANARTTDKTSRLAKIAYEVDLTPVANFVDPYAGLGRWIGPFAWTDSPPSSAAPLTMAQTDSQLEMEPVSEGIVRMEFAFQLKDGTIVANPPSSSTNIAAILCAVAVLDDNTLQVVTPAQLQAVVSALPDAVDGKTPVSQWSLNNLSASPPQIQRNIRFHQRYFYLK